MRALVSLSRTSLLSLALLAGACVTSSGGPSPSWTPASPDPAIINVTRLSFAPQSGVTDAVVAECGLDRKVPEAIAHQTPVPLILAEDPAGGARVLVIQVTAILAPGGGAFSGPKSMTIHGELMEARPEGWLTTASFDARRTTTRGGRTCDMLGYIVNTLAKDIQPWLAAPSLGARLGEA